MHMSFRWYGSDLDSIKLEEIRQIPGLHTVVGCLMDIPVGEIWPKERIKALVDEVEAAGLKLDVIESVNVHDDIKAGLPTRDKLIENYCITLRNLAEYGVKVVCYNFMPVFDWVKSDLNYRLPDGSHTLAFIKEQVPDDPQELLDRYSKDTDGAVLPGWEPERLADIKRLLDIYKDVTEDDLRENLAYFLRGVIPTCEEVGIKMACHPDDPPYSLFGLPRVVKNRDDLDFLCNAYDSPCNGLTLCCGSIGSSPDNDVYAILKEFASRGRIHFSHVRNIKYIHPEIPGNKDFYEAPHLSSAGSLDLFKMCKTLHDNGFVGYIRPDHGRMIWGEKGRAGYGLYDRALGITYINGLWEAIDKSSQA